MPHVIPTPPAYNPIDLHINVYEESISPIPGETTNAIITRVEDTKAHLGRYGQFHVTNIRLLWFLPYSMIINVSIGYHTIISYRIQPSASSTTGTMESLILLCKDRGQSYEFIFNAVKSEQSVFRFFEAAYANYCSSTTYREQKLRSSVIQDGALIMLKDEQVMLKVDSIANFSADVAKIGTALVTNLRFVWYSEIVSNFNVSIPLILLPELFVTNSKRYGKSLYLRLKSGGVDFLYGFTLKPESKLIAFVDAFEKIRASSSQIPVLTPELPVFKVEEQQSTPEKDEDEELADIDPSLMYIPVNEISSENDGHVVFDSTLGLAIEALAPGTTIETRWKDAASAPLDDLDMTI